MGPNFSQAYSKEIKHTWVESNQVHAKYDCAVFQEKITVK